MTPVMFLYSFLHLSPIFASINFTFTGNPVNYAILHGKIDRIQYVGSVGLQDATLFCLAVGSKEEAPTCQIYIKDKEL